MVDLKTSYGLFVDGEFVDPADNGTFKSINPASERSWPRSPRPARRTWTARSAPRAAYEKVWGPMPGPGQVPVPDRPDHPGTLPPRAGRAGSLDNGKPIKSPRDVDLLVAAHFFYYAGWADKLPYAGGPDPKPVGVAARVIPWRLPTLLMLAWKIAPALAAGSTVVLKPARTTPLTAPLYAEICQQAELPAGVVNIVTGAGETGRALVNTPAWTRWPSPARPRSAGRSPARSPAPARSSPWSWVARPPTSSSTPRSTRRSRESSTASSSTGAYMLRRFPAARAGEPVADRVLESLKRRMAQLRVGDPLDKNTDISAINSAAQLERIREALRRRVGGGRRALVAAVQLPERGFWFAPTIFTRVAQAHGSPARRSSGRCCPC